MFQSPRKAGRASTFDVRHFHIHVEAILDTTYSVKVHKLLICFTNNGVYCLLIDTCVFLRLLPRVLSFFFFFFFFDSVLRPFQAFSLISRRINQKVGRKPEYPGKNRLTHPQAELGSSHM